MATPNPRNPPSYSTANLALKNPNSLTPLSSLSSVPHNHYINLPLVILVCRREDLRRQSKTDYYVTSPQTWPHKTVLSVWRDRDTFKPLPGCVVKLMGVAVNKMYDEDPAKKILVKRREGVGGVGHLNIYKGHPGAWWEFPPMGDEVGVLVEWWEGIEKDGRRVEMEKRRVEEEERRRAQEERRENDVVRGVKRDGTGAVKKHIMPARQPPPLLQQERPRSRGRLTAEERERIMRENIQKGTEMLRARGKLWGKGDWWKIDGLR